MKKLCMVVPCYNEEYNVKLLYEACVKTLEKYIDDTEFVFVNDGSADGTARSLKEIAESSPYAVKVINFSRNFGKEAALLAGLKYSESEYTAIIDADMQQNPKYVLRMLEVLEEHPEYDMAAAYQDRRKESKLLSFFKGAFYKIINSLATVEIKSNASDFRVIRRNVLEAVLSLPEKCRFSKGIFAWIGFETYFTPYEVEQRATGRTKWSFSKLFKYAIDGILDFTVKPLVISSMLGFLFCVISFVGFIWIFIKTLAFGDPVAGFPTLACLILLLSGVQLFAVGILGQYMSKNYVEMKNRPPFIVKEIVKSESVKKDEEEK